jgi:hypothetical protein
LFLCSITNDDDNNKTRPPPRSRSGRSCNNYFPLVFQGIASQKGPQAFPPLKQRPAHRVRPGPVRGQIPPPPTSTPSTQPKIILKRDWNGTRKEEGSELKIHWGGHIYDPQPRRPWSSPSLSFLRSIYLFVLTSKVCSSRISLDLSYRDTPPNFPVLYQGQPCQPISPRDITFAFVAVEVRS